MSGENATSWVKQQQQFYSTRPHMHLQYAPNSVYAAHLVEHLLETAQLSAASRVLEVGCGAGRFTIPLLQRFGGSLVAFDLSDTLLEQLQKHLSALPNSISGKCRLLAGNVTHLEPALEQEQFDTVVGFFFLHHMEDLPNVLRQLRRVLRPNGQMLFIEPNRRNPLFLLQVLCCPDMSWAEEKGMFTLGRARICDSFLAAGMSRPTINTFGCFPPRILDRWRWAFRIEKRIERIKICQPVLPFRLIQSRRVD